MGDFWSSRIFFSSNMVGQTAALKIDRAILSYLVSYYYPVRSDGVKVLKSCWNFVKTKTTTPGNNIYTLLITFIAFTSFISPKFQTLFFPDKVSYYAWATCSLPTRQDGVENRDKVYYTRYNQSWNGIKKVFRTILLELFLPFRPFKKTANIRWTTISAQILYKYR